MTREQLTPAFLAALLGEGIGPNAIEAAIARVRGHQLGHSICELADTPTCSVTYNEPLVRSWTWDQARRLEAAK